jgi:hypothetical protein
MLIRLYSIFDSKVDAYSFPFQAKTKGEAIRIITESVNDSRSFLNKHPADYTLFELGVFDDAHASFNIHKTPISLGVCVEFIRDTPSVDSLKVAV